MRDVRLDLVCQSGFSDPVAAGVTFAGMLFVVAEPDGSNPVKQLVQPNATLGGTYSSIFKQLAAGDYEMSAGPVDANNNPIAAPFTGTLTVVDLPAMAPIPTDIPNALTATLL